MLLSITTTHRPETDLGYLLAKRQDRLQTFALDFGKCSSSIREGVAGPVHGPGRSSCGLDLAVLVQGRLIAGPDANGASGLLANYEKGRL
jgi:hypothetical protein